MNQSVNMPTIKGILFDVDGTLYHQTPLRVIMILLLFFLNIHQPRELFRKIKIIKYYRKAQEILRSKMQLQKGCSNKQIGLASEMTGESPEYVEKTIKEWFERRPLPYLFLCRRRGINDFISRLYKMGYKIGAFSDYPVDGKLQALGLYEYFSTIVSSQNPEVFGFKPKTNGFAIASRRMGLDVSEIFYIGDRPDVDGAGATAAGMPVIILNGIFKKKRNRHYLCVNSLNDVFEIINEGKDQTLNSKTI